MELLETFIFLETDGQKNQEDLPSLDSMISMTPKMRWTAWMADLWMEGSCEFKWQDMDARTRQSREEEDEDHVQEVAIAIVEEETVTAAGVQILEEEEEEDGAGAGQLLRLEGVVHQTDQEVVNVVQERIPEVHHQNLKTFHQGTTRSLALHHHHHAPGLVQHPDKWIKLKHVYYTEGTEGRRQR